MRLINRTIRLLVVPSIVVLVVSCMNGGKKESSQIVKASQSDIQNAIDVPTSWTAKANKYKDESIDWLETFNDPVMLKLIKEGKANNIDLKLAAASIEKSWLLAEKSGTTLTPTVDLSLGANQSGNASSGSLGGGFSTGLTASWELDVWGRMSAGIDATVASAQATEADYKFAQHSISANIAKSYLKVIEAKQQAVITRKNLNILQNTLRITLVKYNNGISSGQDVALNRANLAAAEEQLINIEASERNALRVLETLLGRYPDAKVDVADVLPKLPDEPPIGIPSEILERRPDIVAAERKIAAAFSLTAQTKAAKLPRFSLTSNINGASSSLSDILNPVNVVWQLASNLVAPLYDGGKRDIDIKIANVEQKQSVSNYAKSALKAFSEVETQLDQGTVLARREVALNEVVKQNNKAYRIAELRYKEGEIDLLDALTIQQRAISAESNLLSIKHAQLEQRINLYLALGGNW